MGLLLTEQERQRFAGYLELDAKTDADMAEKMKAIGAPEVVMRQRRMLAAAKMLVAKELRSAEVVTID
jgi:hypothetical protein